MSAALFACARALAIGVAAPHATATSANCTPQRIRLLRVVEGGASTVPRVPRECIHVGMRSASGQELVTSSVGGVHATVHDACSGLFSDSTRTTSHDQESSCTTCTTCTTQRSICKAAACLAP